MSDEIHHWFTAREGSTLFWFPRDCPLGMIETHPEHEPIMHWLGGGDEVLKPSPSGAYIIDVPNPHCTVTIDVGKPEDGGAGGTIDWDTVTIETVGAGDGAPGSGGGGNR